MPVPSNPDLDSLIEDALFDAGERDPDATILARAANWAEEIKSDIYRLTKRLKDLQLTGYGVLTIGQSRYSYPSDFGTEMGMSLLYGTKTGVAQAGGSGTITLAANSNISSTWIIGKGILITAGTGVASYSQVTGYDTSTKVATVTPNFKVAPAVSSTYMVIDSEYELELKPLDQYKDDVLTYTSRPTKFYPIGDEDYGEFYLDCPPDAAYGIRFFYYGNIMRVDTDSTQMSNIYSKYRNLFLSGIRYKKYSEANDERESLWFQKYRNELGDLRNFEIYGKYLAPQSNVTDFN